MFLSRVSNLAIYFYEKKKYIILRLTIIRQIEYRKIKILLGIPIEDTNNRTCNNIDIIRI